MVRFLLLRHGRSRNNLENRSSGQYDTPLTDEGREQAARAAEYLSSHFSVDAVYSSDLSRALDTVRPAAAALNLEIHPRTDLRELDVGIFLNLPFAEIKERFAAQFHAYRFENARCPGGENFEDLATRALAALREIAANHPGQTVLIGTHGGLIRTLLCLWDGKDFLQVSSCPGVDNTSLTVVEYEEGSFRVVSRNETEYLK